MFDLSAATSPTLIVSLFIEWYRKQNLVLTSKEEFLSAFFEFKKIYDERSKA